MRRLNPKAPPHTTSGGLSGKDLSDGNQSLFYWELCPKLSAKLSPKLSPKLSAITSPTINRVTDK